MNLMTVLEILNLIGFLRGSPVFPEFCPFAEVVCLEKSRF